MADSLYDAVGDAVLYDMFTEAAARLCGVYVWLHDQAGEVAGEPSWITDAVSGVYRERDMIRANDRAGQIAAIERWTTQCERLAAATDSDQTSALVGVA